MNDSSSYAESINIKVQRDMDEGINKVADGTLDVFLSPISGSKYNSLSSNIKNKTGKWKKEAGYDNIYFNSAHTISPYEVKTDEGEIKFNPFSIQKIRYAANFLINRSEIVNEFYNGHAKPRYLPFSQSSPAYEDHYEKMFEENRFTPEGDKNKGKEMIKQALYSVMNDTSLKGELKPPDNSSNYWRYKPPSGDFENIEVKGVIRIEDQREEIGDYFSDLLEECSIEVIREKPDRTSYGEKVWITEPSDLDWHFYTGSWSPNPTQYFQDLLLVQMYAGWNGYMPGGFVDDADYRYGYYEDGSPWDAEGEHGEFYGNRTLEKISERLYQGKVNSEKQYWDYMEKATELGLNESVRVFICSSHEYMLYNKSKIKSASTNVITGWDDIFTPRTIHTYVENLTMAQYSSDGNLYRYNWNELGGSYDTNGLQEKRMLMDPGTALHPETGKNIPIRCNWYEEEDWYRKEEPTSTVEKAYEWKNNETGEIVLEKNISVPEDVVIYDPANDTWKKVGSGVQSAVKVTYSVVGGKWHAGADLTLRDGMGWHAWSWDMSFKDGPGDDYYHKGFAFQNEERFNTIKGERWDEENQTYTIWGDYTFPVDSRIGSYYSIWPAVPYYQYEAAQFLVSQNDTYIPYDAGTYSWDQDKKHWVNWISEEQGQDIVVTLMNMIDDDYVPWYMTEKANAPITINSSELNTEIQAVIDFYDKHKHVFVSNGPFMMDSVSDNDGYANITRFDNNEGYPFSKDYFRNLVGTKELIVESMDVPSTVSSGKEIEVSVKCAIKEGSGDTTTRDLNKQDDSTVEIKLIDDDNKVVRRITPDLEQSEYNAKIETGDLSGGSYTIEFEGTIPERDENVTETASLIVYGPEKDISVSDFKVHPRSLKTGESVTINAVVENKLDYKTTFDVELRGLVINSYEIDGGKTLDVEEEFTFDNPGNYYITIGNESRKVRVVSSNLRVNQLDIPDRGTVRDDVEFKFDVRNKGDSELEDYFYIDGEVIETFNLEPDGSKSLIIDHTFYTNGTHKISVGEKEENIEIYYTRIDDLEISDETVNKGNKVKITAEVTNKDDITHTIDIKVDDKTVESIKVKSGNKTYTYKHKFDEKGTYEIIVGDESAGEVKVKGKDTPGFGLILLFISISLITLIINKKR